MALVMEGSALAHHVRCCPQHYKPVEFVAQVPLCPEGHEVGAWWVVDVERAQIVAAASVDVVLLGFDQERKPGSKRLTAVPRGAMPGLSEQVA